MRDRLTASEAAYLVYEQSGAPFALKGLARVDESGSELELLTNATVAAQDQPPRSSARRTGAPLIRLMYVSQAAPGLTSADFDNILAEANLRNAQADVTGALCLHGEFFGQILEGPEATVRKTFTMIQSDPRHRQPVVLIEEPARYRLYGGWTMRGIQGDNALTAADELTARLALAQRDDSAALTRRWLELLRADEGPVWAEQWLAKRESILMLRELIDQSARPAESRHV